jgi:hypothetical protein
VTVTITVESVEVSVGLVVVAASSVTVVESLTLVDKLVVVAVETVVALSPVSLRVTEIDTTPSTY